MKKVLLVDDISGDVIEEELGGGTVEFSFDGSHYTIDLGVKNRDAFRKVIEPYIKAAEEVEAPRRRPTTTGRKRGAPVGGSGRSKEELQAVRDWAVKQGMEVAPRGRIKADILEAFDKAHEA